MRGADTVAVPASLEPPKPREYDRIRRQDDIEPLIRFVENAKPDNRNNALYWAARRAAESHQTDQRAAKLLEDAAVRAGLSDSEAAATIQSGFRHG
jgi:hypothetical protein